MNERTNEQRNVQKLKGAIKERGWIDGVSRGALKKIIGSWGWSEWLAFCV